MENSVSVGPNKPFSPANTVGTHSPGPTVQKKKKKIDSSRLFACLSQNFFTKNVMENSKPPCLLQ